MPFTFGRPDDNENVISQRIVLIYQVKASMGNIIWPGFGSGNYNIPLIYYTTSATYIANPAQKFIFEYHPVLTQQQFGVAIYKLNYRLDSIPLHMEVSISGGPDTTLYDYMQPYIKCSSYESLHAVDSSIKTTQQWASLVLHECFHGFQFLRNPYLRYAIDKGLTNVFLGDSLQHVYSANAWFKKSIDFENQALLKAIQANNGHQSRKFIQEFFRIRQERRIMAEKILHVQIGFFEKSFETLEGTSRYIEAVVQNNSFQLPGSLELLKADSNFRTHPYYNEHHISLQPAYLYNSSISDRYFYATGYNLARLLNKLDPGYKLKLFNDPALTLEDICSGAINANFAFK